MYKKILQENIDKIHTTALGIDRIEKNLKLLDIDPIDYCKNIINNSNSVVTKQGKNYYVSLDNKVITINSFNYSVITAHIKK